MPHKKPLRVVTSFAVLLVIFLGTTSASAQQSFQLSSKFYEAEFVRGKFWTGQHSFGNVFCLTFPRSTEAKSMAEAMYNDNRLYYSRAMYTDSTALYVVTSSVPSGRSAEVEIGNLESHNQRNVDAYPTHFKQARVMGLLGPSLVLTIRNAIEGPKEKPFPFMRSVVNRPDGMLGTLSIHRLFVRGSDRIEVAGLRYFDAPIGPNEEADATSAFSSLVEEAAESLQSCTAALPLRTQ